MNTAISYYRQHKKKIWPAVKKLVALAVLIVVAIMLYKHHEKVWNFVVEQSSALLGQFSGSTREPSQQRSALQRAVVIDKSTRQGRGTSTPTAPTNGSPAAPDSAAVQNTPENPENSSATQPTTPGSGQPEEIISLNLPSGNVFKVWIFKVNVNSIIELLRDPAKEDQIVFLEDPLGRLCTFAEYKQNALDGISVAYNEIMLPKTYATYSGGALDGMIKTWNESGEPVYCCQYSKGLRDGFCCYYTNNSLRLLLEIDKDAVKGVHLCANGKLVKSFSSLEQAQANKEAQKLLAELELLEVELKMNEQAFTKAAREEISRMRRERKTAATPQKRAALQERLGRYAAEKQALIGSFWRYKGW